MLHSKHWDGFTGGVWQEEVNVRDFIQRNYTPYDGDESFLAPPTDATNRLWARVQELQKEERAKGGVLDMETEVVSGLTAYGPGYIDPAHKDLEKVVGLQTDKPLKQAFMPYGGIRMAEEALENYGYKVSPKLHEIFTKYHKTHNQAVFDAYTDEIRAARRSHIITGLPDTYGRGRIVGDYRRVALYGIDHLIAFKQEDLLNYGDGIMSDDVIRQREEVAEQIRALKGMKEMAASYGFDIAQPAQNAREAVQWLYFGYLAAIKTQNGAAMSVGRISTFLDIYIQRDLARGLLSEEEAQELIDHLVLKFRMVKFARITSYNELFSGDPIWATLEMAGIGMDGRHMVTKNDFRFLHTLENMGPSPEPNLTVLYSSRLPETFKNYAARISIRTSSIQYENDDVMKPAWGDDYSICCCVSATQTGKEMQFFGARANLAKCLLYAINGGIDEKTGEQIAPAFAPVRADVLDYDDVLAKFSRMMEWLASVYVNALNLIQYMHDKYYYEAAEMALIDTDVRRTFATGIAGFSHVVDSLSAIKYARVRPVYSERGYVVDYEVEGDFPRYGNDDDRADDIARWLLKTFIEKVRPPHLPQFRADDLDPHDHLERRLRQVYGRHARRKEGMDTARARRKSELRCGKVGAARLLELRHEAALRVGARRHLQHAEHDARIARTHGRGAHRSARARARRLLHAGSAPSQRQRLRPRETARRRRPPREGRISELHDPRLGLRREVHQPHARAADGRHRTHLP